MTKLRYNGIKKMSLFGLMLVSLYSCSGSGNENMASNKKNAAANKVIPAVEAVQVQYGALPNEERLSGIVRAENQVEIFPEISGPIEKVHVKNGQHVSEGDVLVTLKERELRDLYNQALAGYDIAEARSRQAKANLDQNQANFKRVQTLNNKELSSDLELDNAKAQFNSAQANYDLALAQLKQAKAQLDQRKRQLAQTNIKSPVEGVVGLRNAEVGMQVSTNTRLFVIGDPTTSIVEVTLSEGTLNYLAEGQDVRIISDRSKEFFVSAKLNRISPFLDRVTHTTTGEIDVENHGGLLQPGMFVQVDVLYGNSEQAALVPQSAIYKHPITGEVGVYVAKSIGSEVPVVDEVDPNAPPAFTAPTSVEFKTIEVLAKGRMKAGVSGVEPGSWVVTVGQDRLVGGATEAKIRTVSWDRIVHMQQLQEEDVMHKFLNYDSKSLANDPDKKTSAAELDGSASTN